MADHYGIALVPDAHKNALNAVLALIASPPEDPTQSENVSQASNASGLSTDPFTYWYGGRQYSDADLAVMQDIGNHLPSPGWPINGVSGSVSLVQAQAAAAALILTVTTQASFTSQQAADTLGAALGARGLKEIDWG